MTSKRNIIVTGASRRLGLFLCEQFVANDCTVTALTRSPSETLSLLSENKDLNIHQVAEYTTSEIERFIQSMVGSTSKIHALVHNASAFEKDTDEYSQEHFHRYFSIHMALPAQLNLGLKHLLYDENMPGNIVHITDIFTDNPSAEHVLYCATKAGLENLSKGYAKKFAPGIRVNSVQPGPIQFSSSHPESVKQKILDQTLLQREGGFMPIFQAICSILENSYMTGASINVDGGRSLGRG